MVVHDSGGEVQTAEQSLELPHVVVHPVTQKTSHSDDGASQRVMQPPLQSTSHRAPGALQSALQPPFVHVVLHAAPLAHVDSQPSRQSTSHVASLAHSTRQPPRQSSAQREPASQVISQPPPGHEKRQRAPDAQRQGASIVHVAIVGPASLPASCAASRAASRPPSRPASVAASRGDSTSPSRPQLASAATLTSTSHPRARPRTVRSSRNAGERAGACVSAHTRRDDLTSSCTTPAATCRPPCTTSSCRTSSCSRRRT